MQGHPVASGRKNWLFLGSPDADDRAATLLSLISTAMRHDLDVWANLKAAIINCRLVELITILCDRTSGSLHIQNSSARTALKNAVSCHLDRSDPRPATSHERQEVECLITHAKDFSQRINPLACGDSACQRT